MKLYRSVHIIEFILCISGAINVAAAVANPGTRGLQAELRKLSNTDRELVLEGTICDSDLSLLRSLSDSIKIIDMNRVVFPDRKLPPYLLFKTGVEKVVLPDGLESIGEWCFAESCLQEITLPSSIADIGEGAFYRCENLKNVNMQDVKISAIPADLFYGCTSLRILDLPVGVMSIGDNAFRRTGLATLDIQDATEIGDFAFSEMPELTTAIMRNHARMGEGVFYGDSLLHSISGSFEEATPLILTGTAISKLDGMCAWNVIGDGAFAGLPIDTLCLGPEIREIGEHAFRNFSRLKEVNAVKSGINIPETSESAFSGVDVTQINLLVAPKTLNIWKEDAVWGRFTVKEQDLSKVEDIRSQKNTDIDIKVKSGWLYIAANEKIDKVRVYGLDGRILLNVHPGINFCEFEIDCNTAVILVEVTAGDKRLISKKYMNNHGKE